MPRKTRHRDVSEVETARAFVLGDRLDLRHDQVDDARRDDATLLGVEDDILVPGWMIFWTGNL